MGMDTNFRTIQKNTMLLQISLWIVSTKRMESLRWKHHTRQSKKAIVEMSY
jgi:hypothetical protein